jgi:hypothetical protein
MNLLRKGNARMSIWLCSLLCFAAPAEGNTPPAPDVIVIAHEDFLPALGPWFAHRQAQGHVIGHLPNTHTKEALRAAIRASAKSGALRAVLIVGDSAVDDNDDRAARARLVPTHYERAKINVLWGSEPEIPTDNYYADLNDDTLPDIAIGRLTADDPADLERMVHKILHYEQGPAGEWRQRINLVAGVGGFGPLVDNVLEMSTRKFLCDGIPAAYHTTMTYGSWRSPFCPDPRRFHEATLDRLNEGSLFWVYIGHGQQTALDRVQVPGRNYHILGNGDADRLRCAEGHPVAIFLACYTGAFDQPEDCLAEELLRRKEGPVAVLSGARVTMPYAMAVLATNMMDEYFRHERATLGDVLLHAKRRMMDKEDDSPNRALLDAIAGAISPVKDRLEEERREHLYLFNLLGDPLLRLQRNESLEVASPSAADAGDEIEISVKSPFGGACTVELICRRDQLRIALPKRELYLNADDVLEGFQSTYEAANDRRWTAVAARIAPGEFVTKIAVPPECKGFCHVRVTVADAQRYALGASNLYIHAPKDSAPALPAILGGARPAILPR